jgi:hypothetical protein
VWAVAARPSANRGRGGRRQGTKSRGNRRKVSRRRNRGRHLFLFWVDQHIRSQSHEHATGYIHTLLHNQWKEKREEKREREREGVGVMLTILSLLPMQQGRELRRVNRFLPGRRRLVTEQAPLYHSSRLQRPRRSSGSEERKGRRRRRRRRSVEGKRGRENSERKERGRGVISQGDHS